MSHERASTAEALSLTVRVLVEVSPVPRESELPRGRHRISEEEPRDLQQQVKNAGVYGITGPVELGALELGVRSQSIVPEEAARSLEVPVALNCAAPDERGILLLETACESAETSDWLVC